MTEAIKIAEFIQLRLLEMGESAEEVERRAGLPAGYIADIIAGQYPYLRNNMTAQIADALGVSRDLLRVNVRASTRARAAAMTQGASNKVSLDPTTELMRLRSSIDNIDAAVVHMLAERFKCTKAVGELKAAYSLPPADKSREAEQITRLRRLADEAGLDPEFAEKFLTFIVMEVIRHHEQLQGKC